MTDRSARAVETGYNGEEAVAEILANMGYNVKHDFVESWDILIDGFLTVEVKTANQSGRTDQPDRRWQFCLFAHPDRQRPVDEDLLILRCESAPVCHFVIPTLAVPRRLTKIDITSPDPWSYRGRWVMFREAWEYVGMLRHYILQEGRTWQKKTESNEPQAGQGPVAFP